MKSTVNTNYFSLDLHSMRWFCPSLAIWVSWTPVAILSFCDVTLFKDVTMRNVCGCWYFFHVEFLCEVLQPVWQTLSVVSSGSSFTELEGSHETTTVTIYPVLHIILLIFDLAHDHLDHSQVPPLHYVKFVQGQYDKSILKQLHCDEDWELCTCITCLNHIILCHQSFQLSWNQVLLTHMCMGDLESIMECPPSGFAEEDDRYYPNSGKEVHRTIRLLEFVNIVFQFSDVSADLPLLLSDFLLRAILEFWEPTYFAQQRSFLNDTLRWTLLFSILVWDVSWMWSQFSIFPDIQLSLRTIMVHTTLMNSQKKKRYF